MIKLKIAAILAMILGLSAQMAMATPGVTATIDLAPGSGPKNVALLETIATATAYITNSSTSSLTIIPFGSAGSVLTLNGGAASPWGIAAYDNAITPKVFVTNRNHNSVSVIDASGGANVEVTGAGYPLGVGGSPMGIAVNNVTGKVYVANNTTNTVTVINAATDAFIKLLTGFGAPYGVAVNSVTNKIYVTNNSAGTLRVINGVSDTLGSAITLGSDVRGVAVDETRNLIYVTSASPSNRVLVLDGVTDTVIGSITVPEAPDMVAAHEDLGLLYVTCATAGRLYVFKSTTPYAQVGGSPVDVGAGAFGVTTVKSITAEPWAILVAAATVDDLLFVEESDSYVPVFDGLVRAVDAGHSMLQGGPAIDLYWDEASDNSTPITYGVYVSTTYGGQNFATTPFYSTTSFGTVTIETGGLTYATQYYIVVRASDSAAVQNRESNTVQKSVYVTDGAPPAGADLTAATNTGIGGQALLSWNTATDDSLPITYYIYMGYSTSSMPFYQTNTSSTGTLLTGLTNGQIHYFKVTAKDASGLESTNTAVFSVTPTDITPPVFAGLNAATNVQTGGTVNVTWAAATDNSGPITYVGYVAAGTTTAFSTPAFTTTQTNYNVQNLTNGTQYAFGVRARDAYGNYDSNTIVLTATPTDQIEPTFAGLSTCADLGTNGKIRLWWSAASDNSLPIYYNIYQATTSGGQNFSSWTYRVASTNTLEVTGLTNGQRYYFVVRAEDSASPTNEDTNLVELFATPTDGAAPVFAGLDSATATANSGEILLSWTAATDSTPPITYNIFRSTTSASYTYSTPSYTVAATTTFTATGLVDGTKYYFVVRAKDASGLGESNTIERNATPNDGTPPVFAGISSLTDTQVSGELNATWAAAADPAIPLTYEIFVSQTSGSHTYTTPSLTATGASVSITGLANNIPYYVVVRARDAGGITDTNTTELFATPTDKTAPSFTGINYAADKLFGGEVQLNWPAATDPSAPITYYVYMRTATTTYDYATTPYVTQFRPYTISGLTDGVAYTFTVGVSDNASPTVNYATNAAQMSVTPTDQYAPAFTGLTSAVDARTNGAIDLKWTAATDRSGISHYRIYYATSSINFWATYQLTIPGTATGTQVSGLENNRLYYFAVRAVDASANSNADTNTVRLTTFPTDTTPPAFAGLASATDTALGSSVQLTWAAATDPSAPITYNIYYTVGTNPSFSVPMLATTSATGCIVSGLTNNQQYYFVVRAKDSAGNETTETTPLTATPTDSIPPVFAGAASAIDTKKGGEATLSWATAADYSPVTYEIYEATTFGGQNFSSPSYTSTATTYTITGLTNTQEYFYTVRARDDAGNTETNTTQVTVTPTDQTAPVFGGILAADSAPEGKAVTISWQPAADSSTPITYNIYLANYPGTQNYASPSHTTQATSTKIAGLTDRVWYYIVVRAQDAATPPNTETNIIERSVMPMDSLGPSAPSGVAAAPGDVTSTPGDEYTAITWTAPATNMDGTPLTDLAGYNVYRSQYTGMYPSIPQNRIDGIDNDGDGFIDTADTDGDLIPASALSYNDTASVVSGTKYYYVVTAADAANPRNQSPYSSEVFATPRNSDNAIPNAPDNLFATPGNASVTLRWDPPLLNTDESLLTDLQGYKVYRSTTSGGNFALISTSTVFTNNYIDLQVTNGTTYYYVVTAIDTATPPNESSYSSQASAKPDVAGDLPPSKPVNLQISPASGAANLTWNAPTTNTDGSPLTDLGGYNVYRNTAASGTFTKVNTTLITNPVYVDNGLINGTTYYYYVTAVDAASNESASSTVVSAVYGSKGITGYIKIRNTASGTVADTGYPLTGLEGITVELCDLSSAVLGSATTGSDGSYKIVYEDASTSATYKARAVISEESGYLPDRNSMQDGTGYRTIYSLITIGTGFTSVRDLILGTGPSAANANCDEFVNMADFNVMKAAFNKTKGQTGYNVNADFNGDEIVNMADFGVLKSNFNLTLTAAPPPGTCQ